VEPAVGPGGPIPEEFAGIDPSTISEETKEKCKSQLASSVGWSQKMCLLTNCRSKKTPIDRFNCAKTECDVSDATV
jgi:hypothetical protein